MTSEELLKQGIAAYKAGRRAEARELLMKALQMDRHNEKTWLWLSSVVDTDAERRTCLKEVLLLNPANAAARRGLEHLRAIEDKPPAVAQPQAILRPKAISRLDVAPQTARGPDLPPAVPDKQIAARESKRDRSDISGGCLPGLSR